MQSGVLVRTMRRTVWSRSGEQIRNVRWLSSSREDKAHGNVKELQNVKLRIAGDEESKRQFLSMMQEKARITPTIADDGKPSKEFIDFFTKLASQVKRTDITARQQMLNSPKTQDFRSMIAKRRNESSKGVRLNADELKQIFLEMNHGKFPEQDTDKWKRLFAKYELVE